MKLYIFLIQVSSMMLALIDTKKREGIRPKPSDKEDNLKLSKPGLFHTYNLSKWT